MLMIRCWTVNPEIRPTFKQLCEDLTTMAKEPCRFIVISNVKKNIFLDFITTLLT